MKKDFPYEYHATCKTKLRVLLTHLYSLGVKSSGDDTVEDAVTTYLTKYPYVAIYDKHISGNTYSKYKAISFEDAFLLHGKRVSVPLNMDYCAEVSAEGIRVGCQLFPLSILDALNNARKEVES
jgi:hypothetical protein